MIGWFPTLTGLLINDRLVSYSDWLIGWQDDCYVNYFLSFRHAFLAFIYYFFVFTCLKMPRLQAVSVSLLAR